MSDEWIEIIETPLDVGAAVGFVTDGAAGGIDVFLGMTRSETGNGKELLALDYEAYREMALVRMKQLAESARQQWPIVKVAMLHRTGRVKVGEASVIIAVACPHRGEAFAACKWLIDQLKIDVPIWKKEVWADGAESWVHP